MGIYSVYFAVFSYLADVYHRYASSAIAGQSFCKYTQPSMCGSCLFRLLTLHTGRNLIGGFVPIATRAMFTRLTFMGACSLLGGVVS